MFVTQRIHDRDKLKVTHHSFRIGFALHFAYMCMGYSRFHSVGRYDLVAFNSCNELINHISSDHFHFLMLMRVREWAGLVAVTCNDISVIYMYVTAHRRVGGQKKKLYLRSCSQHHRHFCRVLWRARPSTDTWPTFLRLLRETAPFQSPFTTRMGIRRAYSVSS